MTSSIVTVIQKRVVCYHLGLSKLLKFNKYKFNYIIILYNAAAVGFKVWTANFGKTKLGNSGNYVCKGLSQNYYPEEPRK